jgi:hypothetical protein
MAEQLSVLVPDGVLPGMQMQVTTQDGRPFMVNVPGAFSLWDVIQRARPPHRNSRAPSLSFARPLRADGVKPGMTMMVSVPSSDGSAPPRGSAAPSADPLPRAGAAAAAAAEEYPHAREMRRRRVGANRSGLGGEVWASKHAKEQRAQKGAAKKKQTNASPGDGDAPRRRKPGLASSLKSHVALLGAARDAVRDLGLLVLAVLVQGFMLVQVASPQVHKKHARSIERHCAAGSSLTICCC